MNKLFKTIGKIEFLRKRFLSFSIFLHNYSYSLIKKFLLKPGEPHPKLEIMDYHGFFCENISKDETVIDIGCGDGGVAANLTSKAKKIIGIDKDEEKIRKAKEKYNYSNLLLISGDAINYDFSSLGVEKFDKIILSNVLEHIQNRIPFLKKLHKISDTILLRVPMLSRDWLTVYKKNNGYKYMLDPTHCVEYTVKDLKEELENSGWTINDYSLNFGEFWGIVKKK